MKTITYHETPFYLVLILFMALAILLTCTQARAGSNIIVSSSHPRADDSNQGNQGRPLMTISEALDRAGPGDTIQVGTGRYREALEFTRGGDPDNPITIKAGPGQEVFILGSESVTGWAPAHDQIWVRHNWDVNSQQVFYNDQPLDQIGHANPFHSMSMGGEPVLPARGSGLHDMYPGSFWYDRDLGALYVWLPDGSSPEDHDMQASVRPHIIASGDVDHVTLKGLIFAHSNTSALGRDESMVNIRGNNWTVQDCRFLYADMGALGLQGQDHKVTDSSFILHGSHGIGINSLDLDQDNDSEKPVASNITLTGNETSYNNIRDFNFSWMTGGVRAFDQCQGLFIDEHQALDNKGAGIWLNAFCRDARVSRSYFSDNTFGASAERVGYIDLNNNIFHGNTVGLSLDSAEESNISFNTFHKNHYALLVQDQGLQEHPLAYNTLQYNLFNQSRDLDLALWAPGFSDQGNVSDYNAFGRDDQDLQAQWQDVQGTEHSFGDLGAFREQTGLERNSVLMASLWTGEEGHDYVPPAWAPVIRAASLGHAHPDLDYYGRVRSSAATDIGAVESEAYLAMADTPADTPADRPEKREADSELRRADAKPERRTADRDPGVDFSPVETGKTTSITITWDDDQSPEPAGYRVYVGTESRNYDRSIDAGSSLTAVIDNLRKDRTYYISAVAYDEQGNESEFAEEIVYSPSQ